MKVPITAAIEMKLLTALDCWVNRVIVVAAKSGRSRTTQGKELLVVKLILLRW